MTDASLPLVRGATRSAASAAIDWLRDRPFATIVGFALLLSQLRTWRLLHEVWATGVFGDTDDATRLVQVRNFLAGQGWFDTRILRFDPPRGVVMHWTHVIDVPIAALYGFFHLFVPVERAEILARLAFPLLLIFALILASAAAVRHLGGGAESRLLVPILAVLSFAMVQFVPGRIDHHSSEIVLLVVFFGGLARSFDPAQARAGALIAAAAVGLSLAISIENLPFIGAGAACVAVAFVVRGKAAAGQLGWFAAGLMVSLTLAFFGTVGPSQWLHPVCDQDSLPWLVLGLCGAAGLGTLAALASRLPGWRSRLLAALLAGFVPLAIFAFAFPFCLHDPRLNGDAYVAMWSANVQESRSILKVAAADRMEAVLVIAPSLLAFLASLWMLGRVPAERRGAWALAAVLLFVGLCGAAWEERVGTSVAALAAVVAAAFAIEATRNMGDRSSLVSRLVWPLALALPFTTLPYVLPIAAQTPAQTRHSDDQAACAYPKSFAGLASLPRGLVFDTIDAGPNILVFTHHDIVAAPYHRAVKGIHDSFQAFLASPAAAEPIVRATHAHYLVICGGSPKTEFMARKAPDGLAANLLEGKVPDWLQRVDVPGPYRVYLVRPKG